MIDMTVRHKEETDIKLHLPRSFSLESSFLLLLWLLIGGL